VVGRTMFDSGQSEDGSVTVLLPKDEIVKVPTQALGCVSKVGGSREMLRGWDEAT